MNIGFVPSLAIHEGGVRQYSLTVARALQSFVDSHPEHSVTLLVEPGLETAASAVAPTFRILALPPADPVPIQGPLGSLLQWARRVAGEGPHRDLWRKLRRLIGPRRSLAEPAPSADSRRSRPEVSHWLRGQRIDLMIYPDVNVLAFETDVPYVLAIHDLQYRLQPQWPEVSADGERGWREYQYRNGARYATTILADSEVGREDVIQCFGEFGVRAEQVRVLPYLPVGYLEDRPGKDPGAVAGATSGLPERFLFYPAQFWPHKNHLGLVRALGHLREVHGLTVPLVLCGSHEGELREATFREVQATAESLGIASQLIYLGYVPDAMMAALFKAATALVMPTYFGPTNLPILEAWRLGCPVLTSDIRGIREQVGDAGVLVDPNSVAAIADGIRRLWNDPAFAAELVRRGQARDAAYGEREFAERLARILDETIARLARPTP